ncbi:endonuclease/exonuclease/phosphatase family protein [Jiangella muralis]|uniref:endonuclease/exonuclease/phosphatase family protein n=1 Tax=Jiangella muralis TaxID=702383 RepID=UPI003B84B0D1
MPDIRILHWNIHSWRDDDGAPNVDAVASLLAATAPDVVSLVEVEEAWGSASVLASLADRFGYAWVFPPTVHHGDSDRPRGGGGAVGRARPPADADRRSPPTRRPPPPNRSTTSSTAPAPTTCRSSPRSRCDRPGRDQPRQGRTRARGGAAAHHPEPADAQVAGGYPNFRRVQARSGRHPPDSRVTAGSANIAGAHRSRRDFVPFGHYPEASVLTRDDLR